MTEKEKLSRREVVLAIIFFLPIWCLRLASALEPLAPRLVSALVVPLIELIGNAWLFGILAVCYALATSFALSAYQNGEYSGKVMGAIMLGAIQFGTLGLVYEMIRPRFL